MVFEDSAAGADPANGDLSLGKALRAVRRKLPVRQPCLCGVQRLVGQIAKIALQRQSFGKGRGQPIRERIAQQNAYRAARSA